MKSLLPLFVTFLLATSAVFGQTPCVDSSLIDPNGACPMYYSPVCGCNGVTYDNDCVAQKAGGVTSWTPGACQYQATCNADFTYSVIVGISGYTVTFTNTSTGDYGNTFWDFGDGNTSYDANPVYTYLANNLPNPIQACLTVSGALATCTNTYCRIIGLDSLQSCVDTSAIDTASICFQIFDPVCGCNGQTYPNECYAYHQGGVTSWRKGACPNGCLAQFTYNIDTTGYIVQFYDQSLGLNKRYHWDFGDGDTSNLRDPLHQFDTTSASPHSVCLTVSDTMGTCTNTQCFSVETGMPTCDASFVWVDNGEGVIGIEGSTPGSAGAGVSWSVDNQVLTDTALSINYAFTDTGYHRICMQFNDATTSTNCRGGVCEDVYVNKVNGINPLPNNNDLKVYPSPTSGNTQVVYTLQSSAHVLVDVLDIVGNQIQVLSNGNQTAGNQQLSFDTKNLPNGLYLIRLNIGGQITTQKLLVIH